MFPDDMKKLLPRTWTPMDLGGFELVEVPPFTEEYHAISERFQGVHNMGPIFRIQNPVLYTKYHMKHLEYESRGVTTVFSLFHDTVQANIESIVTYNIDWRYGERLKFGPGVYFSTSSFLANRRARNRGTHRAMFLVDVLVGKTCIGKHGTFLPDLGCDTVISPDGHTFVKYFDNEFYPTYVQYYLSTS